MTWTRKLQPPNIFPFSVILLKCLKPQKRESGWPGPHPWLGIVGRFGWQFPLRLRTMKDFLRRRSGSCNRTGGLGVDGRQPEQQMVTTPLLKVVVKIVHIHRNMLQRSKDMVFRVTWEPDYERTLKGRHWHQSDKEYVKSLEQRRRQFHSF